MTVDIGKLAFFAVSLSVTVCQAAAAAEIDSVTPRNIQLENSIAAINEIFNQRIEQGIEKANPITEYDPDDAFFDDVDEEEYCDEDALYTELRKAIYQSLTASWGLKGYDLDRQLRRLLARQSYSLLLNDSIYRDIDYIEGFSLNLKDLSDVVNIEGHLVGLDKLGHFFAEGWRYFELTHFDEETFEQALAWGKKQEVGKFGYSTTGIFSHADLAANFNGWRFWNRVLLKQDDPLKGTIANFFTRPYAACKIQIIDSIRSRKIIRAWEQNAKFDLADYIDGAWDEGNNCNSYADPVIESKVMKRIENADPGFSCPRHIEHCIAARAKYGDYARYVLHPFCLTASDD
jgi:hypothetical protein